MDAIVVRSSGSSASGTSRSSESSVGGLQVSVASIPALLLLVAPAINLKLSEQRSKVTVSVAGTLAGSYII